VCCLLRLHTGALKAYDKAIEIHRKAAHARASTADGSAQGSHLPARLLNNAAVLHLRSGDAEKSYQLITQAMNSVAAGGLVEYSPLAQVRRAGVMQPNCAGLSIKPGVLQRSECNLVPHFNASHVYCESPKQQPLIHLIHLLIMVQVTLGYNLARVKEACGNLKDAEAEYRALLKQFPQYGDCCLRLACIAKTRGDTKVIVLRCWHWGSVDLNGVAAS
jgi:hypothetical protein